MKRLRPVSRPVSVHGMQPFEIGSVNGIERTATVEPAIEDAKSTMIVKKFFEKQAEAAVE
jgi:hypothetical protein